MLGEVGEAVEFFEGELVALEGCQHGAAGLGSQIERQICLCGHVHLLVSPVWPEYKEGRFFCISCRVCGGTAEPGRGARVPFEIPQHPGVS